jgi:hypothetical protein
MKLGLVSLLVTLAFSVVPLAAQQSQAASTVGVVTRIDAGAKQIVLKTDAGAEVTVNLQPTASYRRVAPGETDLRNAATIALAEINSGDRVLARGVPAPDQKSVAANLVVVMSQSDIAKKQAADRADWEKRGIVGTVTAAANGDITVTVRGGAPIIVTAGPSVIVRRYAPDSIRFADAKPSKMEEIRVGDQVRARGERSPDGARMTAEEIVSGSFRTIAATVSGIDTGLNSMRVINLDGKKPVTVKLMADSVLRKLPAEVAQQLGGRGGRGARSGDLQQVLDRASKITLADLKNGDAIIVASTAGATPDQVTAITLLSGVEPILTAPGRKDMELGSWSLSIGGGGGGDAP